MTEGLDTTVATKAPSVTAGEDSKKRDIQSEPPRDTPFVAKVQKYWGMFCNYRLQIWSTISTFAFFIIGYLFVAPFDSHLTQISADVPTAWNRAIIRLGIEPIYPPSEDINVGDLYAVLSGDDLTDAELKNPAIQHLLRRSVRIAHIDLNQLLKQRNGRVIFTDSVAPQCIKQDGEKQICASVNPVEIQTTSSSPAPDLDLAVVGFPGISISTVNSSSLDLATLGGGTLGQSRAQLNTITIPEVYTYGVPEGEAFGRLRAWCAMPTNQDACKDGPTRLLLGAVHGDYVYTKNQSEDYEKKGVYPLKIVLKLITRVYLTREIDVTSSEMDSREATAAGKPKDVTFNETSQKLENADGAVIAQNKDGFDLKHLYHKPVVIGYKSVSLLLGCTYPAHKDSAPCKLNLE